MTPSTAWLADLVFRAYAITVLVLALNLVFLWMWSGLVRGKTRTTLNAEDAKQFGTKLVDTDPPPVAHALRAYDNALAAHVPFFVLGLLCVMAGTNTALTETVFAVYVIARWLHSICYLRSLQPWRTVFFVLGLGCLVVLMAALAWRLLQTAA